MEQIHNIKVDVVVQNLFANDPNVRGTIMHGHHPGSQFDPDELFGMISYTPEIIFCINKSWKPLNRGNIDAQINFKNPENPKDDVIKLVNGPHYFIFNGYRKRAFIKVPKSSNGSAELNISSFGKAIRNTEAKMMNNAVIEKIKQSRMDRRNYRNILKYIVNSTTNLNPRFTNNFVNRNNSNFRPNTSNNFNRNLYTYPREYNMRDNMRDNNNQNQRNLNQNQRDNLWSGPIYYDQDNNNLDQ